MRERHVAYLHTHYSLSTPRALRTHHLRQPRPKTPSVRPHNELVRSVLQTPIAEPRRTGYVRVRPPGQSGHEATGLEPLILIYCSDGERVAGTGHGSLALPEQPTRGVCVAFAMAMTTEVLEEPANRQRRGGATTPEACRALSVSWTAWPRPSGGEARANENGWADAVLSAKIARARERERAGEGTWHSHPWCRSHGCCK